MREICMSGSTRGQWVAAGRRSLSYSTVHPRPIPGFDFRAGQGEKHIWPRINAHGG
jgi:hypothetical protein